MAEEARPAAAVAAANPELVRTPPSTPRRGGRLADEDVAAQALSPRPALRVRGEGGPGANGGGQDRLDRWFGECDLMDGANRSVGVG